MKPNTTNDQKYKHPSNANDGYYYEEIEELPRAIISWICQNNKNIIGVWDALENLIFISQSITSLLGHHVSHLMGTAWRQIIPDDRLLFIREKLSGEFVKETFNTVIPTSDGEDMWFECTIEKVTEPVDDKTYLVGLFNKIPSNHEPRELMVRSEKMSVAGQIAAGVAHEIRNPLTALKGFLQLLQAGTDQKEAYINIMEEEIDKIESITSELLFLTKPLTDQNKLESLDSMIQDVILLLQSQANFKGITIQSRSPVEYFTYCDRSQIKQILINVLKNAIEVTDPSGMIIVSTHAVGDYIEIDIIDEGPGIPQEIIHKIGEPFFTTKQNGTGLGLMITKQILEKHNGRLDIIPNEVKGTTFRMSLPKAS